MPITDAKRRANAKWDKDNMTVLGCKVRKDKADKFKAMCKNAGTTPNAIFTAAMDLFMAEHDQASPMLLLCMDIGTDTFCVILAGQITTVVQ